jgi:hypothetical protein
VHVEIHESGSGRRDGIVEAEHERTMGIQLADDSFPRGVEPCRQSNSINHVWGLNVSFERKIWHMVIGS